MIKTMEVGSVVLSLEYGACGRLEAAETSYTALADYEDQTTAEWEIEDRLPEGATLGPTLWRQNGRLFVERVEVSYV